jgi:hypothetical protein
MAKFEQGEKVRIANKLSFFNDRVGTVVEESVGGYNVLVKSTDNGGDYKIGFGARELRGVVDEDSQVVS